MLPTKAHSKIVSTSSDNTNGKIANINEPSSDQLLLEKPPDQETNESLTAVGSQFNKPIPNPNRTRVASEIFELIRMSDLARGLEIAAAERAGEEIEEYEVHKPIMPSWNSLDEIRGYKRFQQACSSTSCAIQMGSQIGVHNGESGGDE
jgi:hypothetical protein